MRTNTSTSITAIDSAAWDALDAGGSPFLRHAFLASLESTGCVGAGTGWQPAPITLHDEQGPRRRRARLCEGALLRRVRVRFLLGAGVRTARTRVLPQARARRAVHARERRTPAGAAGSRRGENARALIAAIHEFAAARDSRRSTDCSSPTRTARLSPRMAGSRATTCSSTGTTSGYRDFDHYLESFTADKRKKAKRERRRVLEDGVTFETLLGTDLDRRVHRRGVRPASRHVPAARP